MADINVVEFCESPARTPLPYRRLFVCGEKLAEKRDYAERRSMNAVEQPFGATQFEKNAVLDP